MITWRHADGTSTDVDENTPETRLLRVLSEALRTVRGQFPSLNTHDTIDELLDLVDELPVPEDGA